MDDSELLVDFVEEAREHLGDIEIQLLQIEAMGAAIDDNLVNTVFRAIHSVKGAAGFLGLEQINAVSHRLEDVLGKVRDKRLVPDPYNVDVMLKAADRLKSMIEDIASSNARDNTEICNKLDAILTGLSVATSTPSKINESVGSELSVKPSAKRAPRKIAAKKPTAKKTTAAENCNTGSASQPNTPAPKQRQLRQSKTLSANDKAVSDRVSDSLDSIDAAMADAELNLAQPAAMASSNDHPATCTVSDSQTTKASTGDSTIRVSVRVLDRLMNLAGELVLSRNQLMQAITADRAIRARDAGGRHTSETPSKLDAIAQGLDQVTTELQETIMQTRMQPIGNVFSKFPRVIRDLSSSLGKEIVLQTEGNEVETDKTIIEAIADPLTHLVRNSCDHGIELPEIRKAAGKPPTGTVVLKAYHQAGKVMIQIIDDGAGINPAVLKAKAIEKGLLTAEDAEKLSDRDAVNLIFAPGFSTAAAITAVSGRGVGMDVVRTNIEKIGGSVAVTSKLGKGSTVDITLPLTLAIVPSMIVTVGGRPYALPQSGIVELIQPDGKEKSIGYAGSAEVLRLRGSLLPLIRMRDLLKVRTGIESENTDNDENARKSNECQLVVVESGHHQFAVAVDQILDSEEIVVKPLGRHLSNLSLLAGSTILGDGRVALILDVAGIAARTSLANGNQDREAAAKDALDAARTTDKQRLVLLSDSDTDRFAISMDIVSRIERVDVSKIEKVGKHDLLQYRGTTLPLLRVGEAIEVNNVDTTDQVYVVVFRVYGHEVGLVTPHLHDIRDCDLSSGVQNSSEVGVAGITVIDGHATRLLDLYGMTELARPEWFSAPEDVEPAGPARVLVCEDSAFFRTFLTRTLLEEGHEVTACEDGEEGWVTLMERPSDFDLLLTDIEMPELNGFELTRRVRADGRFDRLPIIALTSLADDQSTRIGKEVGVSDYQVKMNKPELLASIHRLVGHARCQQNRGATHSGQFSTSILNTSSKKTSASGATI